MRINQMTDEEHASLPTPDWPYLPPSIRNDAVEIYNRFLGAVQTRIADRQKALWSRFIGAGFIKEDITGLWPESNMKFFAIRVSGDWKSYNITDLNLRELDAIAEWLLDKFNPKD